MYNFFPWFGSFEVSLIGKAIDLSLKTITATAEPYVGQMCNLVSWTQFFFFAFPISTRVNIITPLGILSGNIKNSSFKSKKVCINLLKLVLQKNNKNRFNAQFYHEYYLFLSLFAIIGFYDLIHTCLDLKELFFIFPLNIPNGVIIFTLVDIGRAKYKKIVSTKPSYTFDQHMALLWPLWPLNLNQWLFLFN